EVDCPIIYSMLTPPPPPNTFIEGYFVIYAFPTAAGIPSELDVTDVVTVTPQIAGFGIAVEIQTIAPRFIR
ncbi:MAG TPA: hypothetical protein VI685_18100, partial [Candidatus Angelobacter sp.]